MNEAPKNRHRKLTPARRKANAKYISKFVEVKVRMTPERRAEVKEHAARTGESTTSFINRAIDQTMRLDNNASESKKPG